MSEDQIKDDNSNIEDEEDEVTDEENSEDEIVDRIIEESPNKRFQKRNRRFARPVPGVDEAFLALEPETGKEYIWNEIYTNSNDKQITDAEKQLIDVVKKLKKNYHPFLIRFYEIWIYPPPGDVSNLPVENLGSQQISQVATIETGQITPSNENLHSTDEKPDLLKTVIHKKSQRSKNQSKKPKCPKKIVFITERLVEGTLKQYIHNSSKTTRAWKRYIGQILSVLKFFNSQTFNHGYLTNENIFFQSSGSLKIGTFTLDQFLNRKRNVNSQHYRSLVRYLAPEYRLNPESNITPEGDIYALGVLALELAAWEPSWNELLNPKSASEAACDSEQIFREHEQLLAQVEKVQDSNQRDFIKKCLKFSQCDRPNIKSLQTHAAMIEVPTLRLMAAKVIVHNMRYKPNNPHFTNALAQLVDDLTGHLENDTIIGEINFKKENAQRQRTWKDYNFVESTKKFLDDVKNGYYLLFGCPPPYHQLETNQSEVQSGSNDRTALVAVTNISQSSVAPNVNTTLSCILPSTATNSDLQTTVAINEMSTSSSKNETYNQLKTDILRLLKPVEKELHTYGSVTSSFIDANAQHVKTNQNEPLPLAISGVVEDNLSLIKTNTNSGMNSVQDKSEPSVHTIQKLPSNELVEANSPPEVVPICKNTVSTDVNIEHSSREDDGSTNYETQDEEDVEGNKQINNLTNTGLIGESREPTNSPPQNENLENDKAFEQWADMKRPRVIEISSKYGEKKIVDHNHCVIKECEFKYVGLGRWQLNLIFYLLNDKMSEQIRREMLSQYFRDEWYKPAMLVESMIKNQIIRQEHGGLFIHHIHKAIHNQPTVDFEIRAPPTIDDLKKCFDPHELARRLDLLKSCMREDFQQAYAKIEEHHSGLACNKVGQCSCTQTSVMNPGYSQNFPILLGMVNRNERNFATSVAPDNEQIDKATSEIIDNKVDQLSPTAHQYSPYSSPTLGEQLAKSASLSKPTTANRDGKIVSSESQPHSNFNISEIELSQFGSLIPKHLECAVCDNHDYLHRTDIALYLSSPCYHCREYFAKKAGLTPLTFLMLHYEYEVPWPAYLEVRCNLPLGMNRSYNYLVDYDCKIRSRTPCTCYPGQILPPCKEFDWFEYDNNNNNNTNHITTECSKPPTVPNESLLASCNKTMPISGIVSHQSSQNSTPNPCKENVVTCNSSIPAPTFTLSSVEKDFIDPEIHNSNENIQGQANSSKGNQQTQMMCRGYDSAWYQSNTSSRICQNKHHLGGLTLCPHGAIVPLTVIEPIKETAQFHDQAISEKV